MSAVSPEDRRRFLGLVHASARGKVVDQMMAAMQAIGNKDTFAGLSSLVAHLAVTRMLEERLLNVLAKDPATGKALEEIASQLVGEVGKDFPSP